VRAAVPRKKADDKTVVTVKGCARCGGVHRDLEFYRLGRPAKEFQWWSPCPKTGEPILMNVHPTGEEGGKA